MSFFGDEMDYEFIVWWSILLGVMALLIFVYWYWCIWRKNEVIRRGKLAFMFFEKLLFSYIYSFNFCMCFSLVIRNARTQCDENEGVFNELLCE